MKSLSVRDLRGNRPAGKAAGGREFTFERVRRFQEADERLRETCARLGIEKPNMVS